MLLLDRLQQKPAERRFSLSDWLRAVEQFSFNGVGYQVPQTFQSWSGGQLSYEFTGHAAANRSSSVVFAAMATRLNVFSQIRYQYQQLRAGRPGDLFGTRDLQTLEVPWPGGSTVDLNSLLITYADLAGNAYVVRNKQRHLVLLRPDWVEVFAVGDDPDGVDAIPAAYAYHPGGRGQGKPKVFMPDEVAHFAPYPDPFHPWKGESWLTPVIRNVAGHSAATDYKLKFFENGATPNAIIKVDPQTTLEVFRQFREDFEKEYIGTHNAHKIWFLGGGADATVVGSTFESMQFSEVQAVDEVAIANAARVPPALLGITKGLEGSALNAGNYGSAKRQFADETIQHLGQKAAGALQKLVPPPADARLWFDTRDIAFFRDDAKDEAEIHFKNAQTIRQLVEAGFTPDAAVQMVMSGDLNPLIGSHTGLTSVQLQPPSTDQEPASA